MTQCSSCGGFCKGKHCQLGNVVDAGKPMQSAREPVVCLVGIKGSVFDLPTTKRAYTYAEQPGNVVASRLGRLCDAAALQSAGDGIDRGLALLQELQKEGFGVFDLGAEYAAAPEPLAQPEQKPVKFLAYGSRFKISYDKRQSSGKIDCIPAELGGRWVALVAAEDDCHLNLLSPPKRQPMRRATIEDARDYLNTNDKAMWVIGWNECVEAYNIKGEQS